MSEQTPKQPHSAMLKEELLDLAQRLGLTNLQRLSREELVDLVERAMQLAKKTASRVSHVVSQKRGAEPPPPQVSAPIPPRRETEKPAAAVDRSTVKKSTVEKSTKAVRNEPVATVISDHAPELVATTYEENRIVLLPCTPQRLFAFWFLTAEYRAAARDAGGQQLALRLYDVTDIIFNGHNAHRTEQVVCTEWARNWYLPVPDPARHYLVEVGYQNTDQGQDSGQWLPLARSNVVAAATDRPSDVINDRFVTILPSLSLDEVESTWSVDDVTPLPGVVGVAQQVHSISPAQVSVPTGARVMMSAYPQRLSGSPHGLSPFAAAQTQVQTQSGDSSDATAISEGALSHMARQASVVAGSIVSQWVDLDYEVILLGRTKEGAVVEIGGHQVPTGPDGCFSIRRQLLNGGAMQKLTLDVSHAPSHTRQQVCIELSAAVNQSEGQSSEVSK